MDKFKCPKCGYVDEYLMNEILDETPTDGVLYFDVETCWNCQHPVKVSACITCETYVEELTESELAKYKETGRIE